MKPEHLGVCVIVLDDDKTKVLLGKRLNSYKSGTLGLPGGRLEIQELLESSAARELAEETSLKSKKLEYVGAVVESQKMYTFIHFVYLCTEFDGSPTTVEPEKCEGWEWYPLDDLPENIFPGHEEALKLYLQNRPIAQLITED